MKTFGGRKVFTGKFYGVIIVIFAMFAFCIGGGVAVMRMDIPSFYCSSEIVVNESESTAYCVVDNNQAEFNINKHLQLPSRMEAVVFYDEGCVNQDHDGVLFLKVGDNLFYVEIKNVWGKKRVYELTIRRKPMYCVNFNTGGGTVINAVEVMEGECIAPAFPQKEGYDFVGWDYNFSNPITRNIEAKAIWVPKQLYIHYYPNGGVGDEYLEYVRYKQSIEVITSESYTRVGYTFSGWNTKPDGSGDGFLAGESIPQFLYTHNVELYAQWSINSYTLGYSGNISEAGMVLGAGEYDYGSTAELVAVTNDGFTWNGWYDGNGDLITESAELEILFMESDILYFAKWSRNRYSVLLDAVGGAVDIQTQEVVFGENYSLPVPTRNEAVFCGWVNGLGELVTNSLGNPLSAWSGLKNVTLYAKWSINKYNLTINPNKSGNGTVSGAGSWEYGATVNIVASPNDGYKFVGWYEGDVLISDSKSYSFAMPSRAVVYTAKFEVRGYIITLNSMGGVLEESSVEVLFNKPYRLAVPEREGYSFSGWYLGSVATGRQMTDNKGNCLALWNIKTDVTLIAKWELKTYTIKYHLNGGRTATKNAGTYSVESGGISVVNPTRQNYIFDGWLRTGIIGKETELEISSGSTGNRVYYASWKEGSEFVAISSASEFLSIGNNLSGCYYLTQDIDLTGVDFSGFGSDTTPFIGVLDGKGYSVSNLSFTTSTLGGFRGLFHTNNGTIRNLRLENFSLVGIKKNVGTICCNNNGIIEQVIVSASVSIVNDYGFGGIALNNSGKIRNCYTTGSVLIDGAGDYPSSCGGIARDNNAGAEISNCYSKMEIQTSGNVGGIVGSNSDGGKIDNCFFTGSVKSTFYGYAGAITADKEDVNSENCFYLNKAGVVEAKAEAYKSSVGQSATKEQLTNLDFIKFGEFLTIDNLWISPNAVWRQSSDYPKLYWEK